MGACLSLLDNSEQGPIVSGGGAAPAGGVKSTVLWFPDSGLPCNDHFSGVESEEVAVEHELTSMCACVMRAWRT